MKKMVLFLIVLRNGLEDRQYMDWTRTKKSFYKRRKEPPALTQTSSNIAKNVNDNNFYGVDPVLRTIPEVDLCSGGEQTLIDGMKITNEIIKFKAP